jgi:hypothetical protein
MGAVWLRARAQLRGRLLASLLLTLLVGLAGGQDQAMVRLRRDFPSFMAA